jgi:sulfur relay (sulfurtransferase) complex TusBCD TusD component (DsrE family)
MTTVTIVIQDLPYKADNKAWHALRFAGAALVDEMEVRLHLLDDGFELGRRGHSVPQGAVDLEEMLNELMECGLQVRACGMALGGCGIDETGLIDGIEKASMKSLVEWVRTSDQVLTF